jgi:hypothetical protein
MKTTTTVVASMMKTQVPWSWEQAQLGREFAARGCARFRTKTPLKERARKMGKRYSELLVSGVNDGVSIKQTAQRLIYNVLSLRQPSQTALKT